MKVSTNDKFQKDSKIYTILTDSIDGAKGHHFVFIGGNNEFFSERKSKITKKNGWSRIK